MMEALLHWICSPWGLAILGLNVGSFLNVVILRLPVMLERQWGLVHSDADTLADTDAVADLSLLHPPSHCPACGHTLRWWELVPLLSWLVLRGRCSACATRIPLRYPLLEIGTAALFVLMGQVHGHSPLALLWSAWSAALLALAVIDWDTTLLPDVITQPLLWAGLIAAALGWTISLNSALWGAAAGYLSLWAVNAAFKLIAKQDGMGAGDFKLLAALGAWLGWSMLLPILLLSSMVGAAVGVAMKWRGELREGRYIPYGPFLILAAGVVVALGPPTVMAWLGWN